MKLIEVESSNLKAVGFKDNKLFVMFKTSGVYTYENVSEKVYKDLLNADSKGKFLNKEVKPFYNYNRLDDGWVRRNIEL